MPAPWRDDQESDTESTESYGKEQYTIVYRTSKGKKHRFTPLALDLIGPMLDTPSPEDDEEVKKEMYGRLHYAQAFIANKLNDIALVSVPQAVRIE